MAFGAPLHSFRLLLALLGLGLTGLLWSAAPAYADLRVCNQTADPVSIALGYRAESGWQSEGWWVAPPNKCATVYQGDLTASGSKYFYLYVADDIGGGAWDGKVYMCTRDETFTIFGVEDCLARGYERTGFFEVDTNDRADWMLQLTENGAASPGPENPDDSAAPLEGDQPQEPITDPQTEPPPEGANTEISQ